MSKVIDATLRFVDRFTKPMNNAIKTMERSAKQSQRMGKDIQKAGKHISDTGASLTKRLTLPIAAAGVASFKLASDMNESVNKVDVAFGKNANNIKKWSKNTLSSYGIAQGTALDMAATYGDMSTGMGLSTKTATKLSKSIVGLAGDLASFKNISVEQANTALVGIFTGETESLKKLGIVMTQDNLQSFALSKGLLKSTVSAAKMKEMSNNVSIAQQNLAERVKKNGANSLEAQKAQASLNRAMGKQSKYAKGSFKDLTQQQKVMVRYKYIMDKTKNSHGDFARTSAGAANQQRIFTEGMKQLGATIGTKLLPAGTRLIKWANSLVTKFSNLTSKQQDTILKIAGIAAVIGPVLIVFGKLTTGVGSTIKTFGKLGGAIKGGATAFDKLKNVGTIGSKFAKFGNIGKAAFMGITNPAFIAVAALAAIAVAAFLIIKNWTKVKTFLGKLGSFITSTFTKMGGNTKIFSKLFTQVKTTVTNAIKNLKPAFNNIIKFLTPIIKFIKGVFVAGFKIAFSMVGGYISGTVSGIAKTISGLLKVFDGITKFIGGVFTGDWSKAWNGIKEIFGGVFDSLVGMCKTPINAVIGIINGAINGINSIGFTIPKWVPGMGGRKFSVNIPTVPMLAKGTSYWQGGSAMIHDKGAEVVDLPRGSRVYPHDKSIQMARQEGQGRGNITINIAKFADKFEIRSDDDIHKISKQVAYDLADELWKIRNNQGRVVPV